MINVTGLWKNTDKNGVTYYAGNMGGVRVLVFQNDKKGNDKAPDLRLVFAENRPPDKAEGDTKTQNDIPF